MEGKRLFFDPDILTEDEMFEFLQKFYGKDFLKPSQGELRQQTSKNLEIFLNTLVQNGQIIPQKLEQYHSYLTIPVQDGIFATIYRHSPKRNVTKPIRLSLLLSLENDSLINMISELMIVQIHGYEFILPTTQDEFEFFRQRFIRILHWLNLLNWNIESSSKAKIWEYGLFAGYQPDDAKRERTYQEKLARKNLSITDEIIYSESSFELLRQKIRQKISADLSPGDIISSSEGFQEICGVTLPFQKAQFFYTGSQLINITQCEQNWDQIPFEMSFPTYPFGYWKKITSAFRIEIEKFQSELISNCRGPITINGKKEFRTFFRWNEERVNLALLSNDQEELLLKICTFTGRGCLRSDYYFEIQS